jgi:pyruvate kinase
LTILILLQKGPEIRTGNTPGDADIPISAGDEIVITTEDAYATKSDNKKMYAGIPPRERALIELTN